MPNSVDDMKALLSKRKSIARGNRYGVHISHPTLRNSQGSDNNWVTDGRDTWILCTAATIPGKRISTTEATHNHHLAKKPYSMATDEVSMTFLVTGDYYMKKYFDLWQEMIVDSTGNHYKTYYKKDYVADVTITALQGDKDDTVGYSIILMNAYPIQVSQIELGEGVEGIVEVTVTWEYDNWKTTKDRENKRSSPESWLPPLRGPHS
jgi:hypothetical protein